MKSDVLKSALKNDDAEGLPGDVSFQEETAAGWSVLHTCAEYNAVRCLKVLASKFSPLDLEVRQFARATGGERPLHIAASCCKLDVLDELIRLGAVVDSVNQERETPLHVAVQSNSISLDEPHRAKDPVLVVEVVKRLLAAGANINAKCPMGFTALHLLADPVQEDVGYIEVLKLLLASGANPNLTDKSGDTALHVLAECSDGFSRVAAFSALLQAGAILTLRNAKGQTPLDVYVTSARRDGDFEVVRKLLSPSRPGGSGIRRGRTH